MITHVATFDDASFTLQHPDDEAINTRLLRCPVHLALLTLTNAPGIGAFTVTLDDGLPVFEPVPETES